MKSPIPSFYFALYPEVRTLIHMVTWIDHLILWGAFFLIGLGFGLYMGYGLIPSNKNRRL